MIPYPLCNGGEGLNVSLQEGEGVELRKISLQRSQQNEFKEKEGTPGFSYLRGSQGEGVTETQEDSERGADPTLQMTICEQKLEDS